MRYHRVRFLLPLAAVFTAAALLAPAASAAVRPDAGVTLYRRPVCGSSWVPVDLGHGDYFNTYNGPSTCINVSGWHDLAWSVSSDTPAGGWEYPNISSGIEWGTYTCTPPSALPSSPGSECMRYPVQEKADGAPLTAVTWWRMPTAGNVAYDIWFNRTGFNPYTYKLGQANGTEIMIWLGHRNVSTAVDWYFWYRGVRWAVETWTARRGSVTWNYVAYVATRTVGSITGVWLNHFFRDAIAHGRLSPDWWLTGIDFGAEVAPYGNGTGFTVSSYSLSEVR